MSEQILPAPMVFSGTDDELEAHSIKYNVARIVRLSSGRFALFSHYRESTIDLIALGTIEEIANYIPSADECAYTAPREQSRSKNDSVKLTTLTLADLGL